MFSKPNAGESLFTTSSNQQGLFNNSNLVSGFYRPQDTPLKQNGKLFYHKLIQLDDTKAIQSSLPHLNIITSTSPTLSFNTADNPKVSDIGESFDKITSEYLKQKDSMKRKVIETLDPGKKIVKLSEEGQL